MNQDEILRPAEPVGAEQVAEATQLLQKYKAGKAALDRRLIDNELWFRMGHWKQYKNRMMEGKPQPSSGWLFNSIASKWTATPSPVYCPGPPTMRPPPEPFPAFCRWCWNRPTTSRCTAIPGGAS